MGTSFENPVKWRCVTETPRLCCWENENDRSTFRFVVPGSGKANPCEDEITCLLKAIPLQGCVPVSNSLALNEFFGRTRRSLEMKNDSYKLMPSRAISFIKIPKFAGSDIGCEALLLIIRNVQLFFVDDKTKKEVYA
jgi:hypothetical protein